MVYSNGVVVLLCTKAEKEVEITEHSLQQLKKSRKRASFVSLDVLLKIVIMLEAIEKKVEGILEV